MFVMFNCFAAGGPRGAHHAMELPVRHDHAEGAWGALTSNCIVLYCIVFYHIRIIPATLLQKQLHIYYWETIVGLLLSQRTVCVCMYVCIFCIAMFVCLLVC